MRVLAIALLCASVAGCSSDLFHSTEWPTLCDLDPSTPGCPANGDAADERQDASEETSVGDAPDGG